jgi:3-deoxy-D-manno-octulosonic-acid transferase
MMEPTGLGKCTLFGPATFNFRQTVEALLAGEGAIEVADETGLYEQTLRCLKNGDFAKRIGANGQAIIRHNQGATQKTVDAIRYILSK